MSEYSIRFSTTEDWIKANPEHTIKDIRHASLVLTLQKNSDLMALAFCREYPGLWLECCSVHLAHCSTLGFRHLMNECFERYNRIVITVDNDDSHSIDLTIRTGFLIAGTQTFAGKTQVDLELCKPQYQAHNQKKEKIAS